MQLTEEIIITSFLDINEDADLILFLTAWPEYKDLDLAQLSKVMKKAPSIMDGVNLMSRKTIESAGFKYAGIGKPTG